MSFYSQMPSSKQIKKDVEVRLKPWARNLNLPVLKDLVFDIFLVSISTVTSFYAVLLTSRLSFLFHC